jgi:hypothetical protein
MKVRMLNIVSLFLLVLLTACPDRSDDPQPVLGPRTATFTIRNKTYTCNEVIGGIYGPGVVVNAIGLEGAFTIGFVTPTTGIKSFEDASVLLGLDADGDNYQNSFRPDCPLTPTLTTYTIGTINITSIIRGNPGSITGAFEGKVATTKKVDLYSCGDETFTDTKTDIVDVSGKFSGLFYW